MKEISDKLELTGAQEKDPLQHREQRAVPAGKTGVKVGDKTVKIKRG